MNALRRIWEHFEEGFIVFLLAAMTLVTFVYVVLNNLYTLFYRLAESWEGASESLFTIGDGVMAMAQAMTWSTSLTKALFGWLIFFGLSYGVRTAGHIGVDALVRLASKPMQRIIGIIACLFCLTYAGLLSIASFGWIQTLMIARIGAEDLGQYGIMQWHIGLIVPVGFALVFIRFAEILVRILQNRQTGLGLADEAADAMKLTEHEDDKS
ncbi:MULTISPECIES: TRAP transporter small permease [Pseudomonas]|uniref:TRAP transporter small permease n=1 Tax=Pseudomonas TaxID=286 RepID=UPI002096F25C|nr:MULTISPECIES: TRAP transporter small permease [Pseudomonas]MCO7576331.1 TRAP transporter small permease [Pseudomonas protegens]MCO7583175.1 TRAP transporter small permease [Pseudomonas chlororaphis]MCO7599710.1 TRAP transporter small permease [Pseudomonas chlororaphis]MDC7818378.1 TRAP transporter small permease [Pseudomonas sp. BLCC-B112]